MRVRARVRARVRVRARARVRVLGLANPNPNPTDAYPRDSCIAPDSASIVYTTNTKVRRRELRDQARRSGHALDGQRRLGLGLAPNAG